jgi:phosphate starvation-inducible membrane PsiE
MAAGKQEEQSRAWIARGFTHVEDIVYVGLGVLLAGSAVALLVAGAIDLGRSVVDATVSDRVIGLLDRILLILMIVEILYTVQVSFRERALVPEPFLVVGLIATIRRLLVLTAEFSDLVQAGDATFRNAMIELGLLAATILVLVVSLVMIRKAGRAIAEKA